MKAPRNLPTKNRDSWIYYLLCRSLQDLSNTRAPPPAAVSRSLTLPIVNAYPPYMNLPSSLRRILRKFSHYAGPVGATTILRGCPCPPEVVHPPQPYASALAVDANTTLTESPSSWGTYCQKVCGDTSSECYVHVNTSENNSLPLAPACDMINYGPSALSGPSQPWISLCTSKCGEEQDCWIGPDAEQSNKIIINCVSWWKNCAGGRSTEGVTALPQPVSSDKLGSLLAHMATLEAESIPAFRRLSRELAALGAPRKLRRQAARSRRDEQRHARTMTSLARRHGAIPASIVVPEKPLPLRTLEEVALENAREGCVRESLGAWNAWQHAQHARDVELRTTMRRIAMDEARHASLAWEIHRWAMKRLGTAERKRINQAMAEAWTEIQRDSDCKN